MSVSNALRSRPFVGIGILVIFAGQQPGCVLVSERRSSHGQGGLQLPGGHLEFGESFEACAQRELKEETNLDSSSFKQVYVTNTVFGEHEGGPKHYVTVFMRTEINDDSTLKCLEPQNNTEWIWMNWSSLRTFKLFGPLQQAVHDRQFNPFRSD